jgi:hypothetical protein
MGLCAVSRWCGGLRNGGESVSQSPLKDQAFSTFLDQNPPFELQPENGFRLRQKPVPPNGSSWTTYGVSTWNLAWRVTFASCEIWFGRRTFGSDASSVQSGDTQPPIPTSADGGHLKSGRGCIQLGRRRISQPDGDSCECLDFGVSYEYEASAERIWGRASK